MATNGSAAMVFTQCFRNILVAVARRLRLLLIAVWSDKFQVQNCHGALARNKVKIWIMITYLL